VGFPDRVNKARRDAGYTVEQLAEATGIPLRTLRRRLEHRPDLFTVAELEQVAEATHTTIGDLVTGAIDIIPST
jgi:transcriptional regulator with XRE-family HTH domain